MPLTASCLDGLGRRRRTLMQALSGLIIGSLLISAFLAQPYRLVINRTASEPEGIYLIHRLSGQTVLHAGDLVSFRYIQPWQERPYTTYPDGTGFLKRIAGMPGQRVFTRGRCQFIGDKSAGCALTRTPSGVPVPHFAHFDGSPIPPDHYYMVGDGNPDSYDSRYYGLIPRSRIISKARLLWAW